MAFVLLNASTLGRSYRWLTLLHSLGSPIRFGRLVGLSYAAGFFNSVVPSGLAGDVARTVEAAQDIPHDVAAGSVIVDRVTGLIILFVLAILASPFVPEAFPQLVLLQIVLISVAGLAVCAVVLDGRCLRILGKWAPARLRSWWVKCDQVVVAVAGCGWRAIMVAVWHSLLCSVVQISSWIAVGISLGYEIPVIYYFLTVPIMVLVTLMPSIGGLGVRESLAPLLLGAAGLAGGEAIALTLLVFVVERIAGLLGAPIYLFSIFSGNRNKSERESAGLESIE